MLSYYGLIKVLRVKAYTEGTIRLVGVSYQRYTLGRLGDRCYDTFCDHVTMGALFMLPVFDGDLALGMLDGENTKVSPDGIGPKHIANGVDGVRKRLASMPLCPGPWMWNWGQMPWLTAP